MEVRERAAREVTGSWWLFLITGVAWLLIALIVLRFDITSVASVGALLGVILLIAGVNEFMVRASVTSDGSGSTASSARSS
jgi:uncharacterized membrane protein HdeD (DUF308 family)